MKSTVSLALAPPELLALVAASTHADLLLSPAFEILAASDAYLKTMNTTRKELIGQDIQQLLADSPALPRLCASVETAVQMHCPHRTASENFLVRTENGGREQRQFEMVNSPITDGSGEVKWILHSILEADRPDSSKRARRDVESSLEEAEALLQSILQTVPDAMIVIDERGLIESLSTTAERLFGYEMDEVVGKNVSMFMPSPHREQHDSYLERYLKTGERHIIGIGRIVVGQRRDGTTFPMHLTVGELRTGKKHFFTGFIRDLTDQQITEKRLKALQSEVAHMSRFTALGEMASTLAHEINQPLTAINNYLRGGQRLLEKIDGESSDMLREALGKAADHALRAGQIIRRLREFVARGDTERQVESLPKLIEDASTLALIGAKENGIAVSFRLDPKADLVVADRIQIQQVLLNLIRNAIDVLVEWNGRRELRIETKYNTDSTVQISVADSGIGLAPEVAERLFQPFVTTKQKGMGLGLSICRTIVEAHGGKIWVEQGPGGGTIFRFTLREGHEEEENIVE
jgi:two-component system sensor kinase FixL